MTKAHTEMKIMTAAAIKTAQDGIKTTLAGLDKAIHENAIQCVLHAQKHGDTSLMRRLLVEIIDKASGYRRQGLIVWMRTFTPMELKGQNITLQGVEPDGITKRPFQVEKAMATPFWTLKAADEALAKPLYRDTLTSQVEKAIKAYRAAVLNTKINPGNPPSAIDPTKPFYDGVHLDKMEAGFDKIAAVVAEMTAFKDQTKDIRKAHVVLLSTAE